VANSLISSTKPFANAFGSRSHDDDRDRDGDLEPATRLARLSLAPPHLSRFEVIGTTSSSVTHFDLALLADIYKIIDNGQRNSPHHSHIYNKYMV
jgi:hypothetical protein